MEKFSQHNILTKKKGKIKLNRDFYTLSVSKL